LNDLDILAAAIGNAYLNAYTAEKFYTITGPEFGDEAGRVAIIVHALYGLKSSGAAWHAFFAQSLSDTGFISCKSDPDMWLRPEIKTDGSKYYEYVLVYVDDLLVISEQPSIILQTLVDDHKYRLKDVGSPTCYLGASIGKKQLTDGVFWFISAEAYLSKALDTIEKRFGKLESLFKYTPNTPAPTNFHPEIDDRDFLDEDGTTLYQSYIGILRWDIELGRIDLARFGSTMAKFSVAPREGHLAALICGFTYVKKHLQSRIIIDPTYINCGNINIIEEANSQ
jgi:Reverse transcriptase (RNA-dependent DNA polymerase)